MAPETATEKLGRYEIHSELGQGAMGVVYKAIDPLIDRTVAIKTIKFDLSKDDCARFEERFYREAKSAGRLNHPNIVTIYDVGKSDNTAYIAMELLEGQLLKELLDVHTPLPLDKIADIVAQIADGLAYAHKNGIVHRDIKPANIMLLEGDIVKITDFGIARMSTNSGTLAGTVMGSPKYMAPEQVVGSAVDGRSDLFALGVVLYEMLTGESPFDGDNINTTMYRIVNETPTPPKTLNPRLPEVFNYIVAKALAKHPDERYQNGGELARDIRNYKDLTIPESPTVARSHPIALNRKPKPRNNGDVKTILLAPKRDSQSGDNALAAEATTSRTQSIALAVKGFFNERNSKILIGVSLSLVLIFMLTALQSKRATKQKALPTQITEAPLSKPAKSPGNNTSLAEEVSVNSPLPKIGPMAPNYSNEAAPGVAVTPSPPVAAPLPPRVISSETQTTLPTTNAPSGEALLTFAVTPWGDVYVDGKKIGPSPPLRKLKVSAGKHRVEIRNLNFPPYSQTLNLKANSTKKLKHIFK